MMRRALGALVTATALTATLASCAMGGAPGTLASPDPASVVDPSMDQPDPTETPTATASPDPGSSVSASDTPTLKQVDPFVTLALWDDDAGELTASALVPRITETGGTCTLTAVKGGRSVSATADATAGAQSTDCGALAIPGSKLTRGTWTVTVAYVSAGSAGRSESKAVDVTP